MKILLLTLSDNADHQDAVYSMFRVLRTSYAVKAILVKNPKVNIENDVDIKTINAPKRPGLTIQAFNILQLIKMIFFIWRGHFDFIYIESLHIWNLFIWIIHPSITKVIQVIHDVDPHPGDSSVKMVELMNQLTCKYVDAIILRSKVSINRFKEKYKTTKPIEAIDLWRSSVDYTPMIHTRRALFFGRINKYKGIEYLKKITEICNNVQFDIVGRVEDNTKEIVNGLSKLPNVHLCCEYISEKRKVEFFKQADFFILPYKSATQSGVVIDANRYSRPVIAFNVGGIKDQVLSGYNGYLVESDNVEEFSKVIDKTASLSITDLDRLSVSSYDYFKSRFSVDVAAKQLIVFLNFLKKK